MEVRGLLHAPAILPPCKSPQYPLDSRFGGPQNQFGWSGEENKYHHCPCWELNHSHIAHSLVSIMTEIYRKQNWIWSHMDLAHATCRPLTCFNMGKGSCHDIQDSILTPTILTCVLRCRSHLCSWLHYNLLIYCLITSNSSIIQKMTVLPLFTK